MARGACVAEGHGGGREWQRACMPGAACVQER